MKLIKIILAVLLGCWCLSANAADLRVSEDDCAEILERWARDPSSVPQRLVDDCKQALAAPADAVPADDGMPDARPATVADADPCVGPNAGDSVHCWGPWGALAPSAGAVAAVALADIEEFDTRPELADEFDTALDDPTLDLPIDGCPAGTPCGFATVVDGTSGQGEAANTQFARFDLAPDGSSFGVDPQTTADISSVPGMTVAFFDRPDNYQNMRSSGVSGDERSRLIARVVRDAAGPIRTSADLWGHGNAATGNANSGFFAWGTTTSQVDLDALNNGGISIAFAGPMSVDNSTNAAVTINFGAQPSWVGTWTNPAYTFDAGGQVRGADFISNPEQFTSNVGANSFVQGAVLGQQGNQSLAHIFDVDIDGVGRIKDVGLLQQLNGAGALPGIAP